jgi:hypothetical protein
MPVLFIYLVSVYHSVADVHPYDDMFTSQFVNFDSTTFQAI